MPETYTSAKPRTEEKIQELLRRAESGQSLFHPADGQPAPQPAPPAPVAKAPPAMRLHVSLNMAYVRFRAAGRRRVIYFGPWGSEKAEAMYRKFCRLWPEQALNPTPPGSWSVERLITHDGRTQNLRAWAIEHGLKPGTLAHRLGRGMPMETALTMPLRAWTRRS